jgi:hypothetical protein
VAAAFAAERTARTVDASGELEGVAVRADEPVAVVEDPTDLLPPPPQGWSGPSSETDPTAPADLPPPPFNWSGPSLDGPPGDDGTVVAEPAEGSPWANAPGPDPKGAPNQTGSRVTEVETGTPSAGPATTSVLVEPMAPWGAPYEGTTAPPDATAAYGQPPPAYGPSGAYPGWPARDQWAIEAHDVHWRRRRRWLVVVIIVIVLLAAAGLVIGLTRSTASSTPPVSHPDGDRQVAQQIGLAEDDLPSGWTVDHSVDGPLSGLLTTGNSGLTPAEQQQAEAISTQYEACMGIRASEDRIFGTAGADPTAQAASPAFAAPGGAATVEAGTTVDMYAHPSSVQADAAQISASGFPHCFGTALGQLLTASSSSATSSSVLIGSPQIQTLALTQQAGVQTVGVDLVIPVDHSGTTTPLQFGVVLIDGGRAEVTLVTFASPGSFPTSLTVSLAGTLAAHVATYGTGSGL